MDAAEEKALARISAFEISEEMIAIAQHNKQHAQLLDAGRGNPNWINTKGRLAQARLIEFGVKESKRTIDHGDLAGYIDKKGIANRLQAFLDPDDNEIDRFLIDAFTYLHHDLHFDLDEVVAEFTNGVIGNTYPTPSRVLPYTEKILNRYLQEILYQNKPLADQTNLFLTEGGTAAIVYIFNSLKENHILNPGDKIAINTPIFTPYLEIPILNDYDLVELHLSAEESRNWELKGEELDKLQDPSIKAFFLVNPSNPGSRSLTPELLAHLQRAVAKNPNLLIITDDVYGTFVDDFQSVYSVVPYNTLLVYSFSKLFGVTGWRLGMIAVNQNNLFDHLIQKLPAADQKEMNKRYGIVEVNPAQMKFIDRMTADSRSIGLYHTSGLSTPQQILADLFALTHLILRGKPDQYVLTARQIVSDRYAKLYEALGLPINKSKNNSKYYAMIDVYRLAKLKYSEAFRNYLKDNYSPLDFLVRLADKFGIVLMYGRGFDADGDSLRVSEANLTFDDYQRIGDKILAVLQDYYAEYQQSLQH
ncbi:MAG: bifunctional aspartate transaminase/aspartate 4-decarboxylase [Candidatus Paralactobacillus gallistercoris]|uniref:Aminotransferase n=1 Tax=Candidatus Paralactobacillus gallistercoris TaxID=2838724 RepID=A0A948WZ87_9LACO|nr:bifunctional aspartate transaminase/aspartate 4-decarboxylase [Candidatus Paralactobacillus gallistercoris]